MAAKIDNRSEIEILKSELLRERRKTRQLDNELKKQRTVIASFHETTLGLMNRHKIDELLETILKRAAVLLDTANGYMYLMDSDSNSMTMRIGLGLYERSRISKLEKGKAFGGEIWRTGEPLTIDHYASWKGRIQDPQWDCLRAVIGAPLKSHNRVEGVIGLSSTDPNRKFGPDEVSLLGRFAEIASVALENAQLFQALENELSERKRTEAELHLSTERLNAIFNNAKDFIYIKNEHLQYVGINAAMRNALGFRKSGVIHQSDDAILSSPLVRRLAESDEAVMRGETIEEEFETSMMNKPAVIHNIKGPLKNSDDRIIGIFGIARDVTDRKFADLKMNAAKEAVAQAERMASLGVVAAVISHEINQPLNSIKVTSSGIIYLHEKDIVQDLEGIMDDVRSISKQADLIGDIIKHVRSFIHAKNESKTEELQLCDLAEAMDMSLRLIGNQLSSLRIELTQSIARALPKVYATKTGLVEVIVNLLINAMETLDTMTDNQQKSIAVKIYSRDGYLYMDIDDNGPGIPEHLANTIFEPFFTTKKKGESMGLGLSIIKSIVESYGGSIRITNKNTAGALFQVKLPVADNRPGMKMAEYEYITC